MKTIASLLLLAAAPGFASAQATKEDLKKLKKAGVKEDVILAYIRANGFKGHLTSDVLVELKGSGLSDRVLTELITPASPAAQAQAESAPTSNAYASGVWSVGVPYRPYYRYGRYYRPNYGYYRGPYYRPYYRPVHCGTLTSHSSYYVVR